MEDVVTAGPAVQAMGHEAEWHGWFNTVESHRQHDGICRCHKFPNCQRQKSAENLGTFLHGVTGWELLLAADAAIAVAGIAL